MVTAELSIDGISGGAGLYAHHLSKELVRRGHRVDLIATPDPGWESESSHLVLHRLAISRSRILGMLKWSIDAFFCSAHLMRRTRFDMIYIHHRQSHLFPLLSRGAPLVATVHSGWPLTDPRCSYQSRLILFLLDLAIYNKCKGIIALNNEFKNELIRWGIAPENVHFIPNGVNTSEFMKSPKNSQIIRKRLGVRADATVMLCVSRLTIGKGLETLLGAFRIAQDQAGRPLCLIIVGDGPLRPELVDMSRDIKNVVFTGSVSRSELLSLYGLADLFVMPSEGGEGMPTVILEAMAAGLPVIATRVPGNVDLVDTSFGRFFNPGDIQQLALTMLELIHKPSSLNRLGKNALNFSKKYDWESIVSQIAEVCEASRQA